MGEIVKFRGGYTHPNVDYREELEKVLNTLTIYNPNGAYWNKVAIYASDEELYKRCCHACCVSESDAIREMITKNFSTIFHEDVVECALKLKGEL